MVGAKASQPLPSEGPPHFHSPEAAGNTRRTKGTGGTRITRDHSTHPLSGSFWVPFLGGPGTRHTWPSNLVEDWHPVAGDSRLAGLPPSLPSGKPGRYPPSPDTAGLQQPRKSRNLTDHHHPWTSLGGNPTELPEGGDMRQRLPRDRARKRVLFWVGGQEKDGTAWGHIGQQVFLMCFLLEIEICSLFGSSKCRKALLM